MSLPSSFFNDWLRLSKNLLTSSGVMPALTFLMLWHVRILSSLECRARNDLAHSGDGRLFLKHFTLLPAASNRFFATKRM